MADEIGTAYVKVRPDFSSFKGEAQSGIKSALLGVGKLITGALAIKGGIDLTKSIIGDAAQLQKSTETIREEFGAASQSVIDFSDTTGLHLGLAAHTSEDAAARFGILFKNLGIGKDQAAEMTVNLESLAGSIAAIRGKDPGQILGTLPLALSGSLRGLRQLGFAFDPLQEKTEALKLGLITTTQQALDPGAKALAIYGLLTQNLGTYQDQAATHANDAYNVQKRLSAEWDHAKELLGTDLLPQIDKYATELSNFIDKGTQSGRIQADINRIAGDAKQVIGDAAAVVKEFADVYKGFADIVGGDRNAVKILADAFLLLYTRSKLIEWGVIASGEKLVGDSALTASGKVGGLAGALGRLKNLGPIAIAIALDFIPKAKDSTHPDSLLNSPGGKFLSGIPIFGGYNSQIIKLGDQLDRALGLEPSGKNSKIEKAAKQFQSPFLNETFAQAKLVNPNITRQQFELGREIAASVQKGVDQTLSAGQKASVATLQRNVTQLGDVIRKADLGSDFTTRLDALKAELSGKILKPSDLQNARADFLALGKDVTAALGDGVTQGKPELSKAVLDTLQAPIDAARQQLAASKQQLAQDIAAMPQAITDAVNQAKQNLNSIAGQLATDVGSFLDTKSTTAGLGGVLTGRLKELMNQIQSGKATAQTVNIAQELENQLVAKGQLPTDASTLKDKVQRRLSDLADLFNKGALGTRAFEKDIDKVLASAGVKASVIQRTQGVAVADQFRADLADLKKQADAIAAGPKRAGTGLEATIVKPLDTLRAEEQKISSDRAAEARAAQGLAKAQLDAQKKANTLLAKIEAKQPSKHDTAQLEALLKRQQKLSSTNTRARQAGTNRHGR